MLPHDGYDPVRFSRPMVDDVKSASTEELERLWQGVLHVQRELDRDSLEPEVARAIEALRRDASAGGRASRRRFHPLAEAFARVRYEQEQSGGTLRPSRDFVRLGVLGHHISLLKRHSVLGLQPRVDRLWCGDWESFASSAFEIEVAALHASSGRSIKFVPESEERTHDLLVDDTVEVECKSLRHLTQRDEGNREMWRQLQRKVWATTTPGGWYLELETLDKVTVQDVDWVLAQLDVVKNSGSDHIVVEESRRVRISPLTLAATASGMEIRPPPDAPLLETFDISKVEVTGVLQGGQIQPRSGYVFAFRTRVRPDWETRIHNSLKKARIQLSGANPAVVFVEVPSQTAGSEERGLKQRVATAVREAFRQSHRLSAVVACFTVYSSRPDGEVVRRTYEFETNPNAKHAVPPAKSYFAVQRSKSP